MSTSNGPTKKCLKCDAIISEFGPCYKCRKIAKAEEMCKLLWETQRPATEEKARTWNKRVMHLLNEIEYGDNIPFEETEQ